MAGVLRLPVSHLDPPEMRETKGRLLQQAGYSEEYKLEEGCGVPQEAMARARVLCMDEMEMYRWKPWGGVGFVSWWNELKAVRMLETEGKKAGVPSFMADLRCICEKMHIPEDDGVKEDIHDARYTRLLDFLAEGGMPRPRVQPCNFPETTGRGLIFTEDVSHPDPVVAVPRKMLFNVEQAAHSPLHKAFEALQLDDDTRLILFLMHEKFGTTSKQWEPFVALLPPSYDTLFFWDDTQLSELNGSRLLSEALTQKQHLRSVFDALFPRLTHAYPVLFPSDVYTFDNMLWARAVFDSRGFIINIEGRQLTTLIPWAEYINHTNLAGHVSFRRFDEASQCMLLESLAHGKKGTQAKMNYGPMQNSELLLSYGFVAEANPLETCVVEVELDDEDELYEVKRQAVEALKIPTPHLLHYVEVAEENPYHYLMAVLRIVVADSLQAVASCVTDAQCLRGPISNDNETLARQTLAWLVEQLMAEYPTTLDEDTSLLQHCRATTARSPHTEVLATPRLEMALLYRIGQKRILQSAIDWATHVA